MEHNSTNGGDIASSFVYPEFHSTLIRVAGKNGFIDASQLGYWLRDHQDIVIDGRKFSSCGMINGVTRWKMTELERRSDAIQKDQELPF